jgi:hypothetical protein
MSKQTSTINPTINKIIVKFQNVLNAQLPCFNTKEEYEAYCIKAEKLGEYVRELTAILEHNAGIGASDEQLVTVYKRYVSAKIR